MIDVDPNVSTARRLTKTDLAATLRAASVCRETTDEGNPCVTLATTRNDQNAIEVQFNDLL